MKSVSVLIPVYNGGEVFEECLKRLRNQKYDELLVVDSSSADNSVERAKKFGAKVRIIDSKDFNHGLTRTMMAKEAKGEILLFITQDCLTEDGAIEKLVSAFDDEEVAIAYGRQLPREDADPLAAHLRLFNYPEKSHVRSLEDKEQYGMKTVFSSDSFCAYRKSALEKIGWFPKVITAEDAYACGKAILAGFKVAYAADAVAVHSHNFSIKETYRRYVTIGAFYAGEPWIKENFGGANAEGFRYALSEMAYLFKKFKWLWIFKSALMTAAKLLGYKKGSKLAKNQ